MKLNVKSCSLEGGFLFESQSSWETAAIEALARLADFVIIQF